MRMLIPTLIFLFSVLPSFGDTLISNPEHSKISFSVPYMQAFEVEGRFGDYQFVIEQDNNTITSVKGVIKTSSIDTFDKKRDSHLRKDDFFHVSKFPLIELSSVSPIDISKIKAESTMHFLLKMKGIEKKVGFNLRYLGERKDPWTKKKGIYFKGHTTINRKDFGIVWNKTMDNGNGFVVGDKVRVEFDFEFYHSNEKPAFSRFYKPQIQKKNFEVQLTPPKDQSKYKVKPNKSRKKVQRENNSAYSSKENIILTLFTGGFIFILFIAIGILGYKYILLFLDKFKVNETLSYMIASLVVMSVLIILSIYAAPYMGFGVNPLLR